MLYKNCRELPYHNFNEIQETNDLSYLAKDKEEHDELELKRHWIDILEEYFKLNNDFSQIKFFRDKAELKYLEVKLKSLNQIKIITSVELTDEQKESIDKILKKYNVSNIEQDILGTKDDINLKINRFDLAYNNEKKGNFEEALAMMRMNGCQVNRHEITVTEWVALLNQMKKQASFRNGRKRKVD